MIRMMVAAVGLSLGLMVMPVATTPAKADINITIGGGGGKYRISCRRGAEIVEDHGFRRVRARNCSGRNYEYFGRRRGDGYLIKLDARSGRIWGVRRIDY